MISNNEILRWEEVVDWENRPSRQRWLHQFVLFPEYLEILKEREFNSILDYGCGDGSLASFLKGNFENCLVSAYDVVMDMRNIARNRTEKVAVLDSIGESCFDVICLNMVLQDVDNPTGLLQSLVNHLNPYGIIIFSIPHPLFSLVEQNHVTTKRERIILPQSKFANDYARYRFQEIEKVYWSSDKNNWTFLFNRTLQTYSELFYNSGLLIELIKEPVPISEGKCETDLFEIYSKNPGVIFFVCINK